MGRRCQSHGIAHNRKVVLTVACALIGRYLSHMDDYLSEKSAIATLAADVASRHGFPDCEVHVNAADQPSCGSVYLTVTGTSAEAGDDGEVGRGNRSNGLITPCRPMSLEAVAGKNPVTHVGKIYNIVARKIAESMIGQIPGIRHAQCLLVSRIGAPITSPAVIDLKIAMHEGRPDDRLKAGSQRSPAITSLALRTSLITSSLPTSSFFDVG
jgi:S-adenosylmethionine synthetase